MIQKGKWTVPGYRVCFLLLIHSVEGKAEDEENGKKRKGERGTVTVSIGNSLSCGAHPTKATIKDVQLTLYRRSSASSRSCKTPRLCEWSLSSGACGRDKSGNVWCGEGMQNIQNANAQAACIAQLAACLFFSFSRLLALQHIVRTVHGMGVGNAEKKSDGNEFLISRLGIFLCFCSQCGDLPDAARSHGQPRLVH